MSYEMEDNFDLNDDYKPVPLIPARQGYKGRISNATFDFDKGFIALSVVLENNGDDALCDDQESPVDGQSVTHRIFWPHKGDKTKYTSSGKQTKWQWKINNLRETLEALGVDARTPEQIKAAIEGGEFMKPVIVDISVEDFQGRAVNNTQKIRAA